MDKRISGFSAVTTAVTILFCTLIFQMIVQIIFEGAVTVILGESIINNVFLATLCKITYGVAGGLTAWFIYNNLQKSDKDVTPAHENDTVFSVLSPKKMAVRMSVIIIFGLAMQIIAYCALNICYGMMAESEFFKSYGQIISKLDGNDNQLMYIYTMLAAPFVEEYVFRGLIYYIGRKSFGFYGANVLQALMFGLYHGNIIQGVYAFLLGLLLGYMAENRRNMFEPVFLHIVVNFTGIWVVPMLFTFGGTAALYVGMIAAILIIVVIIKSRILKTLNY